MKTPLLLLAFALPLLQGDADQKAARAVAERGLETLRKMVNERNHRSLGFESPKDVADAALGDPLRVSMVRLDQLKEYRAGADAERLLVPLDKVEFPVTVRGEARSSITVEKAAAGGDWKASGFGGPSQIQAVERTRADAAKAAGVPPAALSLVRIPAFNITFVARRAGAATALTSVYDHPAAEVKAGVPQPMAALFERLAPLAQKDDGNPK
jgi:hypothetical protein